MVKTLLLLFPFEENGQEVVRVVYAEVTEYIRSHPKFPQLHYELRQMLREIYPYFLTYPILDRYIEIRRKIRPPYGKGLIGDMDTLIAATALERHLTILTTDYDFARVPNLQYQLVNLKAA
jgi:predicted nucleic acid-binding protein